MPGDPHFLLGGHSHPRIPSRESPRSRSSEQAHLSLYLTEVLYPLSTSSRRWGATWELEPLGKAPFRGGDGLVNVPQQQAAQPGFQGPRTHPRG